MQSDIDTQDKPATTPPAPGKIGCVLVANDLSARADRAVARGVELARRHGAQLVVAYVNDTSKPSATRLRDQVSHATMQQINTTQGTAGAPLTQAPQIETLSGDPEAEILAAVERHKADILVVGRHRNESGTRPIGGTVLDRVIRQAPIPVLLAAEAVAGGYTCAIVGVEFSGASQAALGAACTVAPRARIVVSHSYEVPFGGFQSGEDISDATRAEHQAKLVEMLAGCTPPQQALEPHVVRGSPEQVLRAQVKEYSADLLAVGTHARAGLSRAILGSVAEDLLAAPPCDVLVARPRP